MEAADGDKKQEHKETALRHWASSVAYDPRALFDRVCPSNLVGLLCIDWFI